MFLKVSPTRGVARFGNSDKLKKPLFIGPFQILERIGKVPYRLALPPKLIDVFDPSHAIKDNELMQHMRRNLMRFLLKRC